jgi:hypothetical protein
LHALLHFPSAFKTLNTVASNPKRFLAYEIIGQFECQGLEMLLQELHGAVKKREAKKGQIHRGI